MAVLFVNIHNFVPYFFGVFLFTTFAHGTFLLNEQSSFKEGIFTQIGHKEGHGDLIIAGQSQELPPFVLKGLLVPYGFLTICLLLRNLHIQEHSVLGQWMKKSHHYNVILISTLLLFPCLTGLILCKVSAGN